MGKFFSAIGRIFMSIITLGTYKANSIADSNYTSSESGIRAGFAEYRDQIKEQFEQIINGVSGLETIQTRLNRELEKLNEEEKKLPSIREGILSTLEEDPENEEAISDFQKIEERQEEIDQRQEELLTQLQENEEKLKEKQLILNDLQDKLAKLKTEEENAVSDLALLKLEEDMLSQEMGLKKSIDRSGIDAIRESLESKKAKVKTMSRATGADTDKRMSKYANKGKSNEMDDKLKKILAERASLKKAKQASGKSTTKKQKQREI